MMQVRDALGHVIGTQLEDCPDSAILAARRELNQVYDLYTSRYGALSSRENVRAYAGDPDASRLLALENYDPDTEKATKAAIFEKRTLERYKPVDKVETAAEALTVSLNETGGMDWPPMQKLTGRKPKSLQKELGDLIYRNPLGGQWETADEYLSGNVREKLRQAEAAASLDKSCRRNANALQEVQPEDLKPGDISVRLGSSWIPTSDIKRFVAELLDIPTNTVKCAHAGSIATWTLDVESG